MPSQVLPISLRNPVILRFPEREKQRLDAVLFLDIENPVVREKRIKGDWLFLGIGVIDAILAVGTVMNKVTETFVGVAGVNQQHMGALLIILAHQVIGEERFAGA